MHNENAPPDILFLVGPTAAGKSEVALELAAKLRGEIVSADSMQVYRGLDVLSAKPSREERVRIHHHLIDVINPGDHFDVAIYERLAKSAIAGIRARGHMPIIAGGSGMYVKAVVDGIFKGVGKDAAIRERLGREAEERGLQLLHERLRAVDPAAAARIHPNDKKRIVRALEVFELSGQRISDRQREWDGGKTAAGMFLSRNLQCNAVMFGLTWERGLLTRRIDERVEKMFMGGAVEEVKRIMGLGLDPHATIWQSLGMGEIREYLEGCCSLDHAKETLKKNTRAFARRQMTWFRREPRIRWLDIQEGHTTDSIAGEVMALAQCS